MLKTDLEMIIRLYDVERVLSASHVMIASYAGCPNLYFTLFYLWMLIFHGRNCAIKGVLHP